MRKILLVLMVFSVSLLQAQEYFPINTGVKTTKNTTVAFTNAKIYVTPTNVIKKGTLLVKDGKVEPKLWISPEKPFILPLLIFILTLE
jgi:hypothetical protein